MRYEVRDGSRVHLSGRVTSSDAYPACGADGPSEGPFVVSASSRVRAVRAAWTICADESRFLNGPNFFRSSR